VAQVDLSDGLSRTIKWTRKNMGWIEACIEKHRSDVEQYAGVQ